MRTRSVVEPCSGISPAFASSAPLNPLVPERAVPGVPDRVHVEHRWSSRRATPVVPRWGEGLGSRKALNPRGGQVQLRACRSLKHTASEWSEDEAARLAASLALYTLLSLAPLLVIVVAVAGMVFGEEAARGQISASDLDGRRCASGASDRGNDRPCEYPDRRDREHRGQPRCRAVWSLRGLRGATERAQPHLGGEAQARQRSEGSAARSLLVVRDGDGGRIPAARLARRERRHRGDDEVFQRA